jgi:hypothetical protein
MDKRGCEFIGSPSSGICKSVEGDKSNEKNKIVEDGKSEKSDSNTQYEDVEVSKPPRYAKLVLGQSRKQDGKGNQLYVILNEKIASSAVHSIRSSTVVANELGKSLVVETLNHPETQEKFGLLLQQIFSYESVIKPTRELILWSILLDPVVKSADDLVKYHRDYWLKGDGLSTTNMQLSWLISNWLVSDSTRSIVIIPYLNWYFSNEEICIEPLKDIIKRSLACDEQKVTIVI